MQKTDSTSIISSLQMDYADSDEEEHDAKNSSTANLEKVILSQDNDAVKMEAKQEPVDDPTYETSQSQESEEVLEPKEEVKLEDEISPKFDISDDEDLHHNKHRNDHLSDQERLRDEADVKKEVMSEAFKSDTPSSQGSVKPSRKATRLVSYGPDDDMENESSSSEEEEEVKSDDSPALNVADATLLSRSVRNMSNDDIQIPPEPPGKCAPNLQKNIENMYDRMRREGLDLNRVIQNKKNFRNPSIYEKLIDHCNIDQQGTNFPVEVYDPHIWGKESFFDELDKTQRKDMERREKEKKERTKVEFIKGTKKCSAAQADTAGAPDEKKRKTKWDAQPPSIQVQFTKVPSAQQNPGVANLTSIATGTKATIIPAVGSLSKKPSSGK